MTQPVIKINFISDISCFADGLAALGEDYGFRLDNEGITLSVFEGDALRVSFSKNTAKIEYGKKCEFFRAFGLLLEAIRDGLTEFERCEKANFDTCGGMIDLSHGALMNVKSIKSMIRKFAMMGLNMFMLYREESYCVPEYEYFGYMRGRHTDEDIKEIDDYASMFGIEIIPAIQTLGHLQNTLRWHEFNSVRDTGDCLLADEEKTYEFIEAMIRAAIRPLRSKRVHIGLDETMSLGTGAYMSKHGYVPREEIFCRHLNRVCDICKKYDLKPIIWGDMFFRIGGGTDGYALTNKTIPKKIAELIPENTELTSWDYSSVNESDIQENLSALKHTGRNVWFAGAVHDWHGFCVNYYHTVKASQTALSACKKEGVKDVFITTWGDDSPERDYFCNLLGYQLYAEHMYGDSPDFSAVKKRHDFCVGCSSDMILEIADIDNPEKQNTEAHKTNNQRVLEGVGDIINPSKYLMWQDPIAGLFDYEAAKFNFKEHFKTQKDILQTYKGKYPEFEKCLDFYIELCEVLEHKCNIGLEMKDAYDKGDKKLLSLYASEKLPELAELVEKLWILNRELWFEHHDAFGFEVLDRRYGNLSFRIKTSIYRLNQFINGKAEKLEELEEKRLPPTKIKDRIAYQNGWLEISTAWGR